MCGYTVAVFGCSVVVSAKLAITVGIMIVLLGSKCGGCGSGRVLLVGVTCVGVLDVVLILPEVVLMFWVP